MVSKHYKITSIQSLSLIYPISYGETIYERYVNLEGVKCVKTIQIIPSDTVIDCPKVELIAKPSA